MKRSERRDRRPRTVRLLYNDEQPVDGSASLRSPLRITTSKPESKKVVMLRKGRYFGGRLNGDSFCERDGSDSCGLAVSGGLRTKLYHIQELAQITKRCSATGESRQALMRTVGFCSPGHHLALIRWLPSQLLIRNPVQLLPELSRQRVLASVKTMGGSYLPRLHDPSPD